MINRYTLPEMGRVWDEENKFRKFLEIEILVCEALAKRGRIPRSALTRIKKKAGFSLSRIKQIEKKTRHDVIAFLTNLAENIGPASRYVHLGLTSSDMLDTGLSLLMKEASGILIKDIKGLRSVLKKKARRYKNTVMIGRSHGVHAEPVTFGLKLALFYDEFGRNLERMEAARATIGYGKISGAVGTYAHIEPFVEEYVCKKLKLKPASLSTQILQRDRHAQFITTLAIIGSSLEKMAVEFRGLQRTEVLEVEEPFARGQKGSSSMPHKRNPIVCERVSGLARLLRGNALAAMENVALWHERDISHSSVERVIIPDSAIVLDYMLNKMTAVVEGLLVYPENMRANLRRTKGLIFSQSVLLALVRKGLTREESYGLVQRLSMLAWKKGSEFKELALEDGEIKRHLTRKEIEDCFALEPHVKNVNRIFKKVGI